MRATSHLKGFLGKGLAVALVCCMVGFLVQIVVHDHDKSQDETACQVCHAAHIGSAPVLNTLLLRAPSAISGKVHEFPAEYRKDLFVNDSPSRAPPSI